MNELNTLTQNQSWSKPEIEEIPLSCEITTYSNAEMPEETVL